MAVYRFCRDIAMLASTRTMLPSRKTHDASGCTRVAKRLPFQSTSKMWSKLQKSCQMVSIALFRRENHALRVRKVQLQRPLLPTLSMQHRSNHVQTACLISLDTYLTTARRSPMAQPQPKDQQPPSRQCVPMSKSIRSYEKTLCLRLSTNLKRLNRNG